MVQGFNIPSEGLWFWFEGMIDVFFYVDLALNFFTAYEVRPVLTQLYSRNPTIAMPYCCIACSPAL